MNFPTKYKTEMLVLILDIEKCAKTTQRPEAIMFYFLIHVFYTSTTLQTKTAIDRWFDMKEPPLIPLPVLVLHRTRGININESIEYASSIKMKMRKMSWIAFWALIVSEAINSQNKVIFDDKSKKKKEERKKWKWKRGCHE